MIKLTKYDPQTGLILSAETLTEESFEASVRHGAHAVLDVQLSAATHYIDVSGDPHVIAEYTEAERAALAGLAPGWIWKMPERQAVDQRSTEAVRTAKVEAMSAACGAAIVAGFKSSALGAQHTYPAKLTDQANLTGSILDSLIPGLPAGWTTPFWCADTDGVWEYRPHTATQIQQAGRDGKAAILACMAKNEALVAQIMASTIAEIDQIHW